MPKFVNLTPAQRVRLSRYALQNGLEAYRTSLSEVTIVGDMELLLSILKLSGDLQEDSEGNLSFREEATQVLRNASQLIIPEELPSIVVYGAVHRDLVDAGIIGDLPRLFGLKLVYENRQKRVVSYEGPESTLQKLRRRALLDSNLQVLPSGDMRFTS